MWIRLKYPSFVHYDLPKNLWKKTFRNEQMTLLFIVQWHHFPRHTRSPTFIISPYVCVCVCVLYSMNFIILLPKFPSNTCTQSLFLLFFKFKLQPLIFQVFANFLPHMQSLHKFSIMPSPLLKKGAKTMWVSL